LVITGKDASETMAVSELRRSRDGALTLVLDGTGEENDQPVIVRTILTRTSDTLRITRQSRSRGQPFIMRHSYQLRPAA
jgi:hypothetical protein